MTARRTKRTQNESKANSNSNSNSNNNDDGDDNKHDGDDDGDDPSKLKYYTFIEGSRFIEGSIPPARPEWKKDWENAYLSLDSEGQVDLFLNSYWEEFRGNEDKKKEIVHIYEQYTKVEAEMQPQPVDYVKMNEFLENCKNLDLPTVSKMVADFPDSPDPADDNLNVRIARFRRSSGIPTHQQHDHQFDGESRTGLNDGKKVSLLECLMFIFSKSVSVMLEKSRPPLVERVKKFRKGLWVMERIRKIREVLIKDVKEEMERIRKKKEGIKDENADKKPKFKLGEENKKYILNSSDNIASWSDKAGILRLFINHFKRGGFEQELTRTSLHKFKGILSDCGFLEKSYGAAVEERDAVEKALVVEIEQGSDATKWFKSQIS